MYFSIAPQSVSLPSGETISFRVNPVDTSLVEMHVIGSNDKDVSGTHVLTFKRNGGPATQEFIPTPEPVVPPPAFAPLTPEQVEAKRLASAPPVATPYPSVNKDAVRADDWKASPAPPVAPNSGL